MSIWTCSKSGLFLRGEIRVTQNQDQWPPFPTSYQSMAQRGFKGGGLKGDFTPSSYFIVSIRFKLNTFELFILPQELGVVGRTFPDGGYFGAFPGFSFYKADLLTTFGMRFTVFQIRRTTSSTVLLLWGATSYFSYYRANCCS